MEKQELSRLLGNIACGLDYWHADNQNPVDAARLESLLSAAFHDALHLEPLEQFLHARMPEGYASQFDDSPARLVPRSLWQGADPVCAEPGCVSPCSQCPDASIPPTQRTGEEEPTKTQVDNDKPTEWVPLCGTACSTFSWLKEHGPTRM